MSAWTALSGAEWLASNSSPPPVEIHKETEATLAWFAGFQGREMFVKWYPSALCGTWAEVEKAIAGSKLHPAIVPIERVVHCSDGELLLYPRVSGSNLGSSVERKRFQGLPVQIRIEAVVRLCEALSAVCEAGFAVVDWYEGNMIYDFDSQSLWLFDWELCRPGGSFVLEMDSNYGASRLMAPEEFVRGSLIDERTLVFNLGRFALLYLPELAEVLAQALSKATHPARSRRYESVRGLTKAMSGLLSRQP